MPDLQPPADEETLILNIYTSGMVSGMVTLLVNQLHTDPDTAPPKEMTDDLFHQAVARARRTMADPIVRQQVLDMVASGTTAGVALKLGGNQ